MPPEEHARLLKEVGGHVNAFTTEDLTAYHDTVPPSYVGFALELEAERMRQLKLLAATVDSERQVVEEEKRLRIDNDPIGKAIEKFRTLAYVKHPYNWTPIGTIEDLEKVTPADCQRFYDTYYQPNNATLIVVGDVEEAAVRKLVEQHFGPIPRGPEPPRAAADGAAADGDARPRRCTSRCRSRSSSAATTSRAPSDPDMPALEVLAAVLSAGESSRLHQRLVRREQLAHRRRRGHRDAGASRACSSSTPPTCPIATRPRSRRCCARRSRACATSRSTADELDKAKNQLAAGVRVRAADRRRHRAGAGARAVRRGRLAPLRRGGDPLPGGHRRRRAAGGAQVPHRHAT